MAEQILIDEGRKIIAQLKAKGISLSFAVWYTDPATQSTSLALGARKFDEIGPSKTYEEILAISDSLRDQLQLFKTDYFKLVSLESELGKTFQNSFSGKKGDTIVGMFVTLNFIFHQVYSYGLQGT